MKWKIGETLLCNCGCCEPFVVDRYLEDAEMLVGISASGQEVAYYLPEDEDKLRRPTKLDKVLK